MVVLATGVVPSPMLYYDCVKLHAAKEIYNIGDSFKGAKVFEAVRSAYRCAVNLSKISAERVERNEYKNGTYP